VDETAAWMPAVGSSHALTILIMLGAAAVTLTIFSRRMHPMLRLLLWTIRRRFHRCAACDAHNSSVALWRWPRGRSPCWLCAECAFGVRDFNENLPRSSL
jgi:hypothetical protein